MGVFAEARDVEIICTSENAAKTVADTLNLCSEFGTDGHTVDDYDLFDLQQDKEFVTFSICSGRVQNLDYKLKLIWDQIKIIEGVFEMYGTIMIEGDGFRYSNE